MGSTARDGMGWSSSTARDGMGWSDGMQRGCKPPDRPAEHHSQGHDTHRLHISIPTLNTRSVRTCHEKGGKISIVRTSTTLQVQIYSVR